MMWSNSERRVSQPEIQSFSDRTPRGCYAHRVQDQLKSRHPFLYLFSRRRQSRSQLHQLTVFIDIEHVFDPHTQVLFRNVDARLDREHHARTDRHGVVSCIVHIQSHVVAEAVNEIVPRSEEHTSELQSRGHLVCRLLLEKKKIT